MTNPLNTNPSLPEDDAGLVEKVRKVEPADVWREAYIAVYGCEPTHPPECYRAAYVVIERAILAETQSLSTALAEAREKAIEECAHVASDHRSDDCQVGDLNAFAHDIAHAIRSLTLPEGGE